MRWGLHKFLPAPIASLLSANIFIALATFFTSVVLARALGPEGRGLLATAILWPTLLSHFVLFGTHLYLARDAAAHSDRLEADYRLGGVLLCISCAPVVLIYFVASLGRYETAVALATAVVVPFSAWNTFQIQMELGQRNLATYNWGRTSFALSYLAMVVAMWLSRDLAATHYVLAFAAAAIIAAFSTQIMIRKKKLDRGVAARLNLDQLMMTFTAAWRYAVSTGLNIIASSADRVVISIFFDAKTMGFYVIGIALSQIQSIINEAISPLFFSKAAQHDHIRNIDAAWLAMRLRQLVMINLAIAVLLMASSPILLPLIYGRAYFGAMDFVMVLIPAFCCKAMARPFEETLKGGNRSLTQSAATIVATTIFILGAAVAAAMGSPFGVALASLAGAACGFLLLAYSVSREVKLPIGRVIVPMPSDILALAKIIADRART